MLHLGEINSSQEVAWRQTLAVFDEERQDHRSLSLFADDEKVVANAVNSLRVWLSEMELRRARAFGDCWLGCELWRQLGLEEFWSERLSQKVGREMVDWEKVLRLLVVNRLIDPGSEFRVHRQWFDGSAMGELLERISCSGEGPSVPLPGSDPGTQAGTVCPPAAALGGSVRRRVRCAFVRLDEYLHRRRRRADWESALRLQPRPAVRLQAGRHRN